MRILVDCFGCDFPEKWIRGIGEAIRQNTDVTVVAVGDEQTIRSALENEEFDRSRLEIVNATEIITNNDAPVDAIRHKRDSSLMRALRILREGGADALVSAGSTGAVLVGGILMLGTFDDIERPGLTTLIPCENGKRSCLVDCGANVDAKPENLVEFAHYGAKYIKSLYGVENPGVGLLSVGAEDEKGNAQTKAAFPMLRESGLNFIGNIEGKDVFSGKCDVIVTDGFAGNVLVKGIEGTCSYAAHLIASMMMKRAPEGTDLSFLKAAMGDFVKFISAASMCGAVLLGLKKLVVKAHGNSDETATPLVISHAADIIRGGYMDK